MSAIRAAEAKWENEHRGERRPDPGEFVPIRDQLADVRLDRIAEAIGVSRTAASKIRRGTLVPHPRHWSPLESLAFKVGPKQRTLSRLTN